MYKIYTKETGMPQRLYHKLLLIMRLTTVILLASLLQVSATTFGQRITLNKKNVPLESVLKEIRKQSGYDIFYYDQTIPVNQKITVNVQNAELNEALKTIFKSLPITFEISGKIITVKEEGKKLLDNLSGSDGTDWLQNIDVRGQVVDENGIPLSGASIKVKNGKGVVTSAIDGKFTLHNIKEDATLVVSFIGYLSKEVYANADLSYLVLKAANSKLDEVQVIAYGTTSRRLSTGNVSSIKAEDIAKSPVQNPLLALQGRLPGIFIEQNSGLPGGGVKVRIQGQNSLAKGNDPLYVVDGVPYISQLLPTLSNILGESGNTSPTPAGSGNPLNFINPNDIESIDVLKDADATSIYGSRAANGAILITTKKGKSGQTKFDVNIRSGIGEISRKAKLMNTQQYLEIRREAFKNDGLTPSNDLNDGLAFAPDLTIWDQNQFTDWQEKLLGGTAHFTDAQTSISGGNQNTQFLTSLGYKSESTVFPGNKGNQKGSLHFSIKNTSNNQKFTYNLTGSYLYDLNRLNNIDFTERALTLVPNAPSLYNSDGSLNFSPLSSGNSSFDNPLRFLNNDYNTTTKNLITNMSFNYEIINGLSVSSSFGFTDLKVNEFVSGPLSAVLPEELQFAERGSQFGSSTVNSWIVEPQINYNKGTPFGNFHLLLGSTLQQTNNQGQAVNASGFNSDLVLEDINSATTLTRNGSTISQYKYAAIFSRLSYSLENKYIVNLTSRRDVSSRFGQENRSHNFGSVAGAWIFSEESLAKQLSMLSFGKFRASYGTTGNDQIGDYQFLNLYNPTVGISTPYQGASSNSVAGLANPYLQWELTKKLQFGIDLGFLKDRVLLNVNYNYNRSSNQLGPYNLPFTTGFESVLANFPATIRNIGWEFGIAADIIQHNFFKWTINSNLTIPKNTLSKFPNLSESSYANDLTIGESINSRKYFKYLGVNTISGIYEFQDFLGNTTPDPGNNILNRFVLINPDPKFYGAIQSNISYKGFQLDFLLQFVKQIASNFYGNINPLPGQILNSPNYFFDRWQEDGDVKNIQKLTVGNDFNAVIAAFNMGSSDRGFSDASYIRLKNLSISWSLPDFLKQKFNARDVRFSMQGQNLLTFTDYTGLDPENKSYRLLPPLKMLTFGIQVGL
ncbi:SusC/RagA family TonB-linked outer membrane protein [Pedobacter sp. PWIIR3]